MEPKTKLEISGSALSFLYFTAASSISNSEGFLLGTREQCKSEPLSDTQDAVVAEDIHTKITGILEWPDEGSRSFYSAAGDVDEIQLTRVKEDRDSYVVGWYCFRRGSLALPSVRELLVHCGLAQHFSSADVNSFVFALVQSSASEQYDTHDFTARFFKFCGNQWCGLKGSVTNVSYNDGTSPRKRHYRQRSAIPREMLDEHCSEDSSPQQRIGSLAERIFRQLHEHSQTVSELRAGIEKLQTSK